MEYKEKVMAYANVIQIFGPEEEELNQVLELKIQTSVEDPEALHFWTEVLGRMHRNSFYNEIREMMQLERKYSSNLESYPNIATLTNSPNLLKWISLLPDYEEEVSFLLDYQKKNYITEKPNAHQSFDACLNSMQFFNDAIIAQKPMEELFKYIPLMTWSVEALLVTKQMHEDFKDFLLNNFVPVLRAHRAAVLIFLDLVNNEEKYLEEELKANVRPMHSDIFNREYVAKEISLPIPADPLQNGLDTEDIYLDALSYSLRYMFEKGKFTGPRVEQATRDWFFTPLTHLYRLRMHSDMLGVTDSYTPVMSPKLLNTAANKLYTNMKIYSERNLLETAILGIENLIMDSYGSPYKELYKPRFNEALEMLTERLNDLLREGLITGQSVYDTLNRVKARGEVYEIYSPN